MRKSITLTVSMALALQNALALQISSEDGGNNGSANVSTTEPVPIQPPPPLRTQQSLMFDHGAEVHIHQQKEFTPSSEFTCKKPEQAWGKCKWHSDLNGKRAQLLQQSDVEGKKMRMVKLLDQIDQFPVGTEILLPAEAAPTEEPLQGKGFPSFNSFRTQMRKGEAAAQLAKPNPEGTETVKEYQEKLGRIGEGVVYSSRKQFKRRPPIKNWDAVGTSDGSMEYTIGVDDHMKKFGKKPSGEPSSPVDSKKAMDKKDGKTGEGLSYAKMQELDHAAGMRKVRKAELSRAVSRLNLEDDQILDNFVAAKVALGESMPALQQKKKDALKNKHLANLNQVYAQQFQRGSAAAVASRGKLKKQFSRKQSLERFQAKAEAKAEAKAKEVSVPTIYEQLATNKPVEWTTIKLHSYPASFMNRWRNIDSARTVRATKVWIRKAENSDEWTPVLIDAVIPVIKKEQWAEKDNLKLRLVEYTGEKIFLMSARRNLEKGDQILVDKKEMRPAQSLEFLQDEGGRAWAEHKVSPAEKVARPQERKANQSEQTVKPPSEPATSATKDDDSSSIEVDSLELFADEDHLLDDDENAAAPVLSKPHFVEAVKTVKDLAKDLRAIVTADDLRGQALDDEVARLHGNYNTLLQWSEEYLREYRPFLKPAEITEFDGAWEDCQAAFKSLMDFREEPVAAGNF